MVSRREATGSLLSDFLARFFHGSAEQLILGLVDAQKLDADDLPAIEAMLARADGEAPPAALAPSKSAVKRKRRKAP
jgi:predicted transcriptional regulator